MALASKIEVTLRIFSHTDSYNAAIEYIIKETVPQGVDPQEYLKDRVAEAVGRKIDSEHNLMKSLPSTPEVVADDRDSEIGS